KADWYQNIRKSPRVIVHVGRRRFQANAEFISTDKAIGIMEAYAREHPIAFRELSGLFLGEHMAADSDAQERIARKMPMAAFQCKQSTYS
ncbi:MAG TPA: hypothetical protein VLE49_22190, partial [Anaerolineales bacterium]|nr:hypothetical protein [Anaerolineales bacterium]